MGKLKIDLNLDEDLLVQNFMESTGQQPVGAGSVLAPGAQGVPQPSAQLTPNIAEAPQPPAPSANLPDPQAVAPQPPIPVQDQAPFTDPLSGQSEVTAQLREQLIGQSQVDPAVQQALEDQFRAGQDARKSTIEQLQKALGIQEARGGDIQGGLAKSLANFSDAFFDTDISKNIASPQSREERERQLNLLRRAISQEQGALSKAELDRLQKMQSGSAVAEARKLATLRAGQEFQTRRADKAEDILFKEQNKIDKDFKDAARSFSVLDESLARNDYQSVMSVLGNFARQISGERGVLTDKDIERVIPRSIQGDVAKVKAYFSNTPTAAFTPEFVTNLRELVKIAKQKTRNEQVERVDFLSDKVRNQNRFTPIRGNALKDLEGFKQGVLDVVPLTPKELKEQRLKELREKAKRGK